MAADTLTAYRDAVSGLAAERACAGRSPALAAFEASIPGWNPLGRSFIAAGSISSSWTRLGEANLQIALTQRVFALETARRQEGRWPAALPPGPYRCGNAGWTYAVTPDGGMTLRPGGARETGLAARSGLAIPLTFVGPPA
jgi:hypothetical protein